jgi:hypothetical protein
MSLTVVHAKKCAPNESPDVVVLVQLMPSQGPLSALLVYGGG